MLSSADEVFFEKTAFIDGNWIEVGDRTLKDHISPIDRKITVGRSIQCSIEDVNAAIGSAKSALISWSKISGMQRGNLLFKTAQLIEEHNEEIAKSITLEMGKPIGEARMETNRAVALLRYYAGEGMRAIGEVLPASDGVSHLYTVRVPLGVVGIITPWNFPIAIPLWKIAPALIFGNTVVWKPAEFATITAARIMQLFVQAGIPRGVLNLVSGSGTLVGQCLTDHPDVNGISFTGSNKVGKIISRGAAERGAKYQLEMGGKNASIVLQDADLSKAADVIISAAMRSSGQKCTATSRVIIEKPIAQKFTDMLVERVKKIKLSDPREDDCYLGPVVSKGQQEMILKTIHKGQEEGCELLTGGKIANSKMLIRGCYIEPTIFKGVSPGSDLWQEEIFGPVIVIAEANDLEHAIELANGVKYGLAAALFTAKQSNIQTFINHIEAGLVKVNGETAGVELQAPFGGMKQSSSYSREQGRAAIEFYTQVKTVVITP